MIGFQLIGDCDSRTKRSKANSHKAFGSLSPTENLRRSQRKGNLGVRRIVIFTI